MTLFFYTGQARDEIPENVKHLVVADGQVMIPERAFKDHPSLETVTMSSSVKEIGYRAFYGCTNLAYVYVQKGLTKIGHKVFQGCTALVAINVPETVIEIGGW